MRIRTLLTLAGSLALLACERQAAEQEAPAPAAEPPAAAAPEPAAMPRTPSPEGATVYFIAPLDTAEVTSPVNVVFGLKGAGVAPAGIDLPNTGHHHLLVDTELADENLPVPANAQSIHFGLGQTETTLELPAGEHTLQLVLGDHLHRPHDPPLLSERITVTVVE